MRLNRQRVREVRSATPITDFSQVSDEEVVAILRERRPAISAAI